MGLFDSIAEAFSGDVFSSIGGIFEGDFDFENIAGTILPGVNALTEQFESVGSGFGDLFSGDSSGAMSSFTSLLGGGGDKSALAVPAASRVPVRGYTGARAQAALFSQGRAPARAYQQVQQAAIGRLSAASPDRDRCIALLDLVDNNFPSDEIPRSLKTGCRTWLTATPTTFSPIRSSTFPTPQYGRPQPGAFPAWAQPRGRWS